MALGFGLLASPKLLIALSDGTWVQSEAALAPEGRHLLCSGPERGRPLQRRCSPGVVVLGSDVLFPAV